MLYGPRESQVKDLIWPTACKPKKRWREVAKLKAERDILK